MSATIIRNGWIGDIKLIRTRLGKFPAAPVLAEQPVPWIEVRGSVAERLAATNEFLEPLLGRSNRIGPSLEELGR